jgi:hypothetical protein
VSNIRSVHGLKDPDRFAPLAEAHPAVGLICPGCDRPLRTGDRVMFVNGRPADDEEAAKAAAGRPYNEQVDLAHQDCAIEAALDGGAAAYA